ncbi:MAG: carbon-nitrogen hydrolase family protein [Nakamurella sp.]
MRIAAAQTSPVWLNPDATADKVTDWIGKAAQDDVELVAFGETFLSGYPWWVADTGGAQFNNPAQKAAYAAYVDAAVELDGPQVARVVEAASDHGVFTYLGIAERGRAPGGTTVYATLLAIDPQRGVVSAHRKLMPTYEERMVWGIGDGNGLKVHDGPGGMRVGGLNCWENWMPQARHALYAQGEHLHVSVWPGCVRNTKDITRFIALEGRVWSLAAGSTFNYDDIPADFPLRDELLASGPLEANGGSAIATPDGSWVVEPVDGAEQLVIADIDLDFVRRERHNFDPTGHYSRPDVFDVTVHRQRLNAATFED